ncbi:BREX-2 system phosphatase PglZ [Lentzea sp. DG1S-22]|uniref:BREX-2 system phosphatase PglZ n=1 Tax=Lentzea sp. DG1S-22 TaxID=3108822 RepID=UPI002E763D17|nr:BREX-2 system phosphatase PglZ [Lentzea sp. DG1S-22]WVH77699.1 BREX-2 system phosphatase PglZ [Lentzea sp. DG1S-22]
MAAVPEANRRVIEALLEAEMPRAGDRRLVLVHGRYDPKSPTEFTVRLGEEQRNVKVTDQSSVLGIVDAWQTHRSAVDGDDILVVTTDVSDAQLGWDLRAYAVGGSTRTVDRVVILKQRFGAADIDSRIRQEGWLVEALLEAEPPQGWRRAGQVLTRDAAVRALIGARLGGQQLVEGNLDAGALLSWSQNPAGLKLFAGLPEAERSGLTGWLVETVGDAAVVVMSLAAAGRAEDAMALGVLGAVVTRPEASNEAARAFGSLLGSVRARTSELRAFVDAVEGVLERWITEARSGTAQGEIARERVLDVVAQADELAAAAELTEELSSSRFLESSFRTRFRSLAAVLSPSRRAAADSALSALKDHALADLFPQRVLAATMAVRLARWLAEPEPVVDSVSGGVGAHVADWGWVDRALTVLWAGDGVHDPAVGQAYQSIHDAARARRDRLDRDFARLLARWTVTASTHAPGGCLLIEDVLPRIVLPLSANGQAPLVVVLDGMSSAVAIELGDQLTSRAWHEATPATGARVAAVAAVPSVTLVSRTSLLTAGLAVGDQPVQRAGFEAFWRKHRRQSALFFKGDIGGRAGQRLAEPVVDALAGDDVVGVVLNTIDDALEHGREGDRVGWRPSDITYLPELLDAARAYGRPVVLVSDHGHVLDRSAPGEGPTRATEVESVRWRTGKAEDGEVVLAGPRVLYGDGSVVVPWREDIRYLKRKAGYHGGASLAEMTVPVLVLLPAVGLLPSGWTTLPHESIAPIWWETQTETPVAVTSVPPRKTTKKPSKTEPGEALFPVPAADRAVPTLGTKVVESTVYDAQRAFVPKAPNKPDVAAVIDALADGKRSLTAIASVAGRAGRNPDFLVTTLQRLLNVEGYPVLSLIDGGLSLELNTGLLCEQFGVKR